jgi:YjgF/chorismate_mutase-like, putative endoribonuclease
VDQSRNASRPRITYEVVVSFGGLMPPGAAGARPPPRRARVGGVRHRGTRLRRRARPLRRRHAARLTALSILASLKRELGELDRVTEWLRVVGYVHCVPGVDRNAAVADGFSDLIVELWGEAGRHARSAPGQGPSPLGVPIIVDAIVAVA